ncbi:MULTISPECIES: genetic competence negative regulator [Paenibacillus]|jgi:adapter protein MecA 1/2|uniref:Genetic competence negative regulator n=1 Tax=Paenibacillus oceani TaxID=2772510 RepID=A0A927C8A4_9BACL|nr:genetic competence negative regulator [Paenibacillus oceani]MBD2861341.1 genetic competence negative regulator [Paenibacillus oceani]MDF2658699.1 tic competence negative regulator [Paenibacillus sp.]
MKIERLSLDKIRIFLTFDDLTERGIQKEDMWREIPKVHELFSEMMEQAYTELGFDASGPLAVEVFQLPAQGMVVIVTRGKVQSTDAVDEEEAEEVYEMEVTLEQSDVISYAFHDFEHLLKASHIAFGIGITDGALYHYKDKYILQILPSESDESRDQALIAILSEFGEATSVTTAVLDEYGKRIIAESAVKSLCEHFRQ